MTKTDISKINIPAETAFPFIKKFSESEKEKFFANIQIREFNKEVFIVAQTAFGLSGSREKAIEAGCNAYISKPINKEELRCILFDHFKK